MLIEWKLETKNISDLVHHPKNPRQLTKSQSKQLTESLSKFGLIEKPIINLDNTIIGGHQRVSLLKKQGVKEIECWVPSQKLDDKDVDELNIRLNKNQGEFDYDILANQFEVMDLINWGFDPQSLFDEIVDDEEKPAKEKKKKTCPECGCEF